MLANHDFLHPLQPLFSIMADKFRAVELEEERIAHIAGTENVEPSTVKEQRIRLVNKRLLWIKPNTICGLN